MSVFDSEPQYAHVDTHRYPAAARMCAALADEMHVRLLMALIQSPQQLTDLAQHLGVTPVAMVHACTYLEGENIVHIGDDGYARVAPRVATLLQALVHGTYAPVQKEGE